MVQHRTKICMYIQERIPAEGLSADEYDFLRSIGVDFVSIDRLPTDTLGPDAGTAHPSRPGSLHFTSRRGCGRR